MRKADARQSRQIVPIYLVVLALLTLSGSTAAQEYVRPVSVAPTAEDIGGGYVTPEVQRMPPHPVWRHTLDAALLAVALLLSAWIGLRARSRNWLLALTIACLIYFGFFREGCVCPIGATQNVTVALVDASYSVPYWVIAIFLLPLLLALLLGRVFCGGVCPLGAIQELVVLRPLTVPRKLDKTLGSFKYIYLIVAIVFAALPEPHRDFVICRFDPFVGFFRQTGPAHMLAVGGVFLILGTFVGRPYCRYLCPYGALLAVLARFTWRGVTITSGKELDCGLCTQGCPYGAIEKMRAVRSSCLSCARCYTTCPEHRVETQGKPAARQTVPAAASAEDKSP